VGGAHQDGGGEGHGTHGRGHSRALVHRAVSRPPARGDGARGRHDPAHAARGLHRLLSRHPQDQRDGAAQGAAVPGLDHRGRGGSGHTGGDGPGDPRGAAGSQLAILRSASHLSNVEQPEEFNRALRGFLDKASGRARSRRRWRRSDQAARGSGRSACGAASSCSRIS
jgi:hypothetical protein